MHELSHSDLCLTGASRPMLYLLSSGIVDVDTHISLSEHTNCQIDSLKVHRGRETFMEIDSFGFTLTSSNGTIKVGMHVAIPFGREHTQLKIPSAY